MIQTERLKLNNTLRGIENDNFKTKNYNFEPINGNKER